MNKIEMFKKDFFLYNVKIPDSKSEITENYNTLIKTIENSLIENRSIPTPYIIITDYSQALRMKDIFNYFG